MSSSSTSNASSHHHHGHSPAASQQSASPSVVELQLQQQTHNRMGQLFDENDHTRCSDGNRKALLAEKMEQLRGLVKEFETDDWKYAAPVSVAAATATKSMLGDAKLELGSSTLGNEEDDEDVDFLGHIPGTD